MLKTFLEVRLPMSEVLLSLEEIDQAAGDLYFMYQITESSDIAIEFTLFYQFLKMQRSLYYTCAQIGEWTAYLWWRGHY